MQSMISNGGKPSFCSGGRVGRNEGTTAERRSRELLQQNYVKTGLSSEAVQRKGMVLHMKQKLKRSKR